MLGGRGAGRGARGAGRGAHRRSRARPRRLVRAALAAVPRVTELAPTTSEHLLSIFGALLEHVLSIFCALGAFPNNLFVHLLRWPPSGLNHFAISFWAQVSRPEHFRNRNEIKLVDGTRPNYFRAFFEHFLIIFGALFKPFLCLRGFQGKQAQFKSLEATTSKRVMLGSCSVGVGGTSGLRFSSPARTLALTPSASLAHRPESGLGEMREESCGSEFLDAALAKVFRF